MDCDRLMDVLIDVYLLINWVDGWLCQYFIYSVSLLAMLIGYWFPFPHCIKYVVDISIL